MHEEDAGCGCFTLLMIFAIYAWLSDNWETILLVVVAVIAIGVIIAGIRSYNAKAPEREAAAKVKAEQEAKEKCEREEASYKKYEAALQGSEAAGKLKAANVILEKLFQETDPDKRIKILAFFDKYLPLMTEILEASKHGDTDLDDSVKRFTETVKSFSRSLYKVDDVVNVNKAMMESLAISDGLYDPYAETLSFDMDDDRNGAEPDNADTEKSEPEVIESSIVPQVTSEPKSAHKTTMTVEDVEQAMQDRLDEAIRFDDFDTIRDMLDSGVISEFDIDDDVLEKVEEYV